MENTIYTKFKALSEKERLTADDKAAIEEVAEAYGLTINKKCSNCYRDAAIQIALANKPTEEPEAEPEQEGYVLRDGIDITLHSYRHGKLHVCAKECTTENAERWIAAGIPLSFFKHVPDGSND